MESKQTARPKRMINPKSLYGKPGGLLITALVVAIGAILALAYVLPRGERIDSDRYQLVYLVSGQAYFGKLQNTDGNYLLVKNAYTTQNQSDIQDNVPSQTAIIKVSEQVYGPDDTISLKSDQVVFWQNLRDDSKVVQAIESKS